MLAWRRGRVVLLGDGCRRVAATTSTMEMRRYEALRRGRARIIQRSSRATNATLYLSDGATAGRAARLAESPKRFGWIHEFDALSDATSRASVGRGRRACSLHAG